jgi:hypothetical protein
MAYTPFKMKGSPFARNYGIGASPAKQTRKEQRKIRKLEKEEARVTDAHSWKEAYDKAQEDYHTAVKNRIEFHKEIKDIPVDQITRKQFYTRDLLKHNQDLTEKNVKKANRKLRKAVRRTK